MPDREDNPGPPLSIERAGAGHRLVPEILESIRSVYHRDPEPIRRELEAGRANLRAIFEGSWRAGYLLLTDCRSPLFHLGNRIDPGVVRPLLENPRLRIWAVSLLHGEPGTMHTLEELGKEMLRSVGETGIEPWIFVNLPRGGDPRSWRLFPALGFRERGAPSWLSEFDFAAAPARPELRLDAELRWLEEESPLPLREIAEAYNDVFGGGAPILSAGEIGELLSGPACARGLSAFLRDRSTGAVTGFLFASFRPADRIHIDCIGIRKPWRGRGYIESAFGIFSWKARESGIRHATFVTGRPEVCKFAERRFGARRLDELVWLMRSPHPSG